MNEKERLFRIGELSRITGVASSTINYYVREGLLPPPIKTAPNMAYYDSSYLERINEIRLLQKERGMALSEIKKIIRANRDSQQKNTNISRAPALDTNTSNLCLRELDRRKQIMEGAEQVFARKGYFASTIADIAHEAGVAKGTIYWYFENKRAIMLAILEYISEELTNTFLRVVRRSKNGLEALLGCVEPAMRMLDKHGPIYLMYFFEIGSTDPLIQEKFRKLYRSVYEGVKAAVNRGIKQAVIRELDPEIAAYAIMGIVERASQIGWPEEKRLPLETRVRETRELIRRALCANPSGKNSDKTEA